MGVFSTGMQTLYIIPHQPLSTSACHPLPSQQSPPVAPRTKNKDNPRALRGLFDSRDSHGDWPSLCSWFMATLVDTQKNGKVNSWRIDFSSCISEWSEFLPLGIPQRITILASYIAKKLLRVRTRLIRISCSKSGSDVLYRHH